MKIYTTLQSGNLHFVQLSLYVLFLNKIKTHFQVPLKMCYKKKIQTKSIKFLFINKFINLKFFESREAYEEHKTGLVLHAFLKEADEMVIEGPNVIFEGYQMYSCD